MRIKCLLLGTKIATGGAERLLLDLAGWLHDQGEDVTAAFFYDQEGLLEKWKRKYPFEVACLDNWSPSDPPFRRACRLAQGFLGLAGWLKREQFDAMLTFTHDSNLLGLPAAWLAGVRHRYGSHHVRYPSLTPWRQKLHSCLINSHLASGLVAVSSFTRQQALEEGVRSEKIHVIHNGVRMPEQDQTTQAVIRKELHISPTTPLVVSVGRLVEQKGQSFFVEAAAHVTKKVPDCYFALAGDGPLREDLEQTVHAHGLVGRFLLLGNRPDVPALLAASDLFVLTSRFEGMPVALLEAMASGLAVISTDISGVRDVIRDEGDGLLVPLDDATVLAEAIVKLISNDTLRKEMGHRARQKIQEEFSLQVMGKRYLKLLGGDPDRCSN